MSQRTDEKDAANRRAVIANENAVRKAAQQSGASAHVKEVADGINERRESGRRG
jgi:hypothetical protein